MIRVEYIPDEKDDIAGTLLRLKERVGHNGVIFTSGGIGPTHDDITYESVAHAFGAVQLSLAHSPYVLALQHHEAIYAAGRCSGYGLAIQCMCKPMAA